MNPSLLRWLVSGTFGLLVGWQISGLVVPMLGWLAGTAISSGEGDYGDPLLPVAVGLFSLIVVAVAVTFLLARVAEPRRRLGWGCLLLGGALLLAGPGQVLATAVLGPLLASGQAGHGAAGGILFVLMLSLPYALLGIALVIGGLVLRKAPATGS